MIPPAGDAHHWLFVGFAAVVGVAMVMSLWRLVRGPSLADRVVALDLLAFVIVGIVCVFSMVTQQPAFLSVALVAALVLFLGTAAFAVYLQRRGGS